MGIFQNGIKIVEKPKNNKTNGKIKYSHGYGAIGKNLMKITY